jgi:hypothetical protein
MGRLLISVRTYSGHKADERPVSFTRGRVTVQVEEIVDRWYGPDHSYFKLVGDNGRVYVIRHDTAGDTWEIVVMEDPTSG